MDQLKAIECFIAVAQTQSFSKAAALLNRPISSVSRQVTALETSLQAELLIRSTRQLRLTEVGRFYLQECQAITEKLTNAREQVSSYHGEPSGLLRISAMTSFGELVLAPLIEEFQARYPEVVIDAEFSDQVQDLTVQNIDLCFRGGALPDKRLIAYKVMDNHFHLCASPAYLAAEGAPTTESDLKRHKAIFYRGPNGRLPWWIVDGSDHRQCNPEPALITNSVTLMTNALVNGKGLCLLPMWALHPLLENGSVVRVDMDNPPLILVEDSIGLYLLYLQSRYQVPKVKCAVDFFREQLARQ